MDMIGSSDPYVVLELLPFSLYHKPQKEYRTVMQKRTLNPEFNETFNWWGFLHSFLIAMSSPSLLFKASTSTECSSRTRCCPAYECLGRRLCQRWFYRRMFHFAAKYCPIEESRFSTRCASDGSPLTAAEKKHPTKSIWSRERMKYFAQGNLIFPSSWFAIGRALMYKPRHFWKNEMRWCSQAREAMAHRWWAMTAILQVHIPAPRYVPYSACFHLISASVRNRPLRIAPTSWMMTRTLSNLHVGMSFCFVLFRFVSNAFPHSLCMFSLLDRPQSHIRMSDNF